MVKKTATTAKAEAKVLFTPQKTTEEEEAEKLLQQPDTTKSTANVIVNMSIEELALKHVLHVVMKLSVDCALDLFLQQNQVENIFDMITFNDNEIDKFVYEDPTSLIYVDVPPFQKSLVRMFKLFLYKNMVDNNNHLTNQDVLQFTHDEWTQFRMDSLKINPTIGTTGNGTKIGSNNLNSELQNFIKGVKRDKTQYQEIKDERHFDNWQRSFLATVRSHRIENVFNSTYVPSTPEEKLLFQEQLKFAYTVLDATLKTDMGKALVRKYEYTFDAQKIWQEFVADARNSTKAQIASSDILSYITSAKYDNTWKGTSSGFILYWINKVREYDTFIDDPTEKFSNTQKLAMLQNTVSDVPELRQVRISAELEVAKGGQRLDYNQYTSLLLSASSAYDKINNNNKGNVHKQFVYNTNLDNSIDNNNNNNNLEDEDVFDVDTYLTNVTARKTPVQGRHQRINQTSANYERNFIPREDWNRIPKDVQALLTAGKKNNHDSNDARKINLSELNYDVEHSNDNNINNDININKVETNNDIISNNNSNNLLAYMSNQKDSMSSDDIRRVLSTNIGIVPKNNNNNNNNFNKTSSTEDDNTLNINGVKYRKINKTSGNYNINAKHIQYSGYSLVDRGANGGVFGNDVRIIEHTNRTVSLTGLDNHQINDLPICTGAGYGRTQNGPVIFIMHQYAFMGQGKSIHSSAQFEAYKLEVDDRSRKIPGGKQRIKCPDGYLIPLDIIQGLPYMKLRPPTDHELKNLPHVILTSDNDWDPSILDNKIDESNDTWFDASDDNFDSYTQYPFDDTGNYKSREISELKFFDTNEFNPQDYDDIVDDMIFRHVMNVNLKQNEPNYEALQPNFGWAPLDVIKNTFKNTTQYVRSLHLYNDMRKHYKSRFPAFNVMRRNEAVATDTIFSDTSAIDDGSKCAQFFVGRESLVSDVYGMKTDKEFVNTLEDNIRRRGAMDKLISDRAKSEISEKVLDILRALMIKDWQSEPYHQHQNFSERRYATIKSRTNVILNRTGAPAHTWLLCMQYICTLLNHLSTKSLDWRTPMQVLTGETSDISIFLLFHFWEEVYYTKVSSNFPSSSTEEKGNFVGFADTVGDAMTFKILSQDTLKIIYRSNVRTAEDKTKPNLRLNNNDGNDIIYIKSKDDNTNNSLLNLKPLPGFNPTELIGKYYMGLEQEDGQKFRMKIIKAIANHKADLKKHPDMVKFLVQNNRKDVEEILTYQDILHHLQKNEAEFYDHDEQQLKFKNIISHKGPINQFEPEYNGSKYNLLIEWEDGECTYEPLGIIAEDDPISCAEYAKENGLLETPGWKRFKRFITNEVKLHRIINQIKTKNRTNKHYKSSKRPTKYKYGFKIPTNHNEAVQFDKENNNTCWQDAEALEIKLLHQYCTFEDLGIISDTPENYKRIRCLWVYDVKHDGRHRARLVAGGHLTPVTDESVYSGVVTLRGLRLVVFLSELNNLQIWGADVGSAYLEAVTKELVCFTAGPEFKELEGHTLKIFKALYGLRTSGLRWHERFADILRSLNFYPSKAENDIWMREINGVYEYIAVYVDDIAIAAHDPESIIKQLEDVHKLKLKGTGPMKFHLGCDFFRDPDGTLCFGPKKYIDKIVQNYEMLFKDKPKEYSSPLEKNDHPELDMTEYLDETNIKVYQSMIGALQWAVSLGRFDIHTTVMTMSQFRIAPKEGHLNRLKRVYGYLSRFREGVIRVRTEEPDYSGIQNYEYDWSSAVYGEVEELIPRDIPKALGKPVTLTTYVDANLYHDLITGRAVTGILHLINKTPLEWYSKKQATVETATYGSEFVAARISTDQIIDLRTTLRYLGVPIRGKSFLFGDNQSVITNSTIPHSTLKKRHNALSYHRVREAISANILCFNKIDGKVNPSDILSKHCGYVQAWPMIKALLFWRGNTAYINNDEVRTKGECQDLGSILKVLNVGDDNSDNLQPKEKVD